MPTRASLLFALLLSTAFAAQLRYMNTLTVGFFVPLATNIYRSSHRVRNDAATSTGGLALKAIGSDGNHRFLFQGETVVSNSKYPVSIQLQRWCPGANKAENWNDVMQVTLDLDSDSFQYFVELRHLRTNRYTFRWVRDLKQGTAANINVAGDAPIYATATKEDGEVLVKINNPGKYCLGDECNDWRRPYCDFASKQ